MLKKSRYFVIFSAIAFAIGLFVPVSVTAQKANVIELSYGTPYIQDHVFSKTDIKWMNKIEKETNGKVKFKPFWGGQLIGGRAEAIDEIAKGVADVGFISPGQSRTGYDLAKASLVFFAIAPLKDSPKIFKAVLKKFPEIEQEYKGLKVMCWSAGLKYDLLTRKPVRTLADMKGMRLKTLGEIVNVLKDLGVEGVASPMPELYMNMQKGIIDGGFVPYSTLKDFKFAEVAKYVTNIDFNRAHLGGRVMSLTTYNKLPADVKKVIDRNIEWYGDEADKDCMLNEQGGVDYGKQNSVEFIDLPKADKAKFDEMVYQEGLIVAKKLDDKGLPGTKILNEIKRLVAATAAPAAKATPKAAPKAGAVKK
jgi:TRAP-type C4-dicarboxylate transport system substrate-binding protein